METFNLWKLLAGLGIFLFGIFLMEESIKELAGKAFKTLIRRYTETKISSVLSGALSTSILQSSSAVNLMVLAFVGAGIMSLNNAIGVILGANIGTTITAWIVAFFGFKISIESFALPLIAIGGLGFIIFSSAPRYLYTSKLLIGFGLLFHGLDYMKTSVDQITQIFDITMLSGYSLLIFLLVGIVFTAVMQSSSATIALILSGIYSGLIEFEAGAAMVIGANVGTTVTVMLGALGGIPIKKRVAIGHLVFNIVTGIVVFLLLPVLVWAIQNGLGWNQNAIMGIAMFHTLFNLIGIILFLPFITIFTDKLNTLFQEPRQILTHYIQNTSPEVSDAALEAFKKEILHQYVESRYYLIRLYNLSLSLNLTYVEQPPLKSLIPGSVDKVYERLKELHGNIFEYYSMIDGKQLDDTEAVRIDQYLRASRNIMNATKNLKEVRDELEQFELSSNTYLTEQLSIFQQRLEELFNDLDPIVEQRRGDITDFNHAIDSVDDYDVKCINESSQAIKNRKLKDLEATSMVMTNRLFTQSCRMFVFGIKGLLSE
ncbi:sodium:phosphate symporter [Aliifodinibius salipaludis]|uniref:Sodium:phosphate symporter n=1 Tax=Fodinibius salipaludis TaxID=2032627 RepID=A0A2A2GAM8_9BACT|nr:Na/Pi symporter [Aliifodinibius salipaludis]PAU94806.1 sodium:phosphate symporter [Aliifodinibius salipaludis]